MTWVDWIILAVILAAVFGGMAQGFFRAAFGLAGLVIGLMAALWNYPYLARVFLPIVRLEALANAIGFLLIVILIMLAAAVIGAFLERTFRWAGLGCLDSLLGAVLGFLEGIAAVMIFVLVTLAFFPGTWWLSEATLPPMFFRACHVSMEMSPKQLSDQVHDSLKKLKRESPSWVHPGHGTS